MSEYACPYCETRRSLVRDSRPSKLSRYKYKTVRRRRECLSCGVRYSTYEIASDHLDAIVELADAMKLLRKSITGDGHASLSEKRKSGGAK